MLVWQGFGFLAAVIPVVFLLILSAVEKVQPIPFGREIALLLSSVVVWFVGRKLNRLPGRILIDPETQQPVEIKRKNTFFWIPMEYIAVVIVVVVVAVLSKRF